MKTKRDIDYDMDWCGYAHIPAGTPVTPADNLPGIEKYWVEAWENMTETEESWLRNYGFLIRIEDVDLELPEQENKI